MAFILRYNTTMNGAMTFTGNTMGLNKVANQNNQGTAGSIGAFITLNTSSQVGNFPLGTTLNYIQNSSAAILSLPAGSEVLYAELIWAGSYNYGGSNVSGAIPNPITFTTPAGTFSVAPDPATAANTAPAANFYVNSANVTALVQQAGAGTYVAAGIPGTASATENNTNFAGWTLAVAYASPFLPSRNMSIFVGAEIVNATIGAATASITGFGTPVTGAVTGRLMVSACEGDPQITGDQALFGPTVDSLVAISGPNNPVNNFFASQINNDQGLINTNGTFGNRNSAPGTPVIGARQGWDITNVDVSAELVNSQTSAVIRLLSTQDQYMVNSAGLQVDVNAPFFVFNKNSNVTSAFVGDTIQYTITASNVGTASATLVLLTDSFPSSGSFVPGSLSVDGVPQPGASPVTGLNLGVIAPGQTVTIVYSVQIVSRPSGSTQSNVANLTYNFQSLPGGPVFEGMSQSNGNNVTINNRPPTVPNYAYTTNENVPVSSQVIGTDPDGDPLTYSLNSIPTSGTVVVNADGTFTYTPDTGYVGPDSFTVLVSDGLGGTAVSTVAITIVNRPPLAQNLNLTTNKNTPINGQIVATDPDGDTLTYALNSPPASGTVTVNPNGSLTYTPNPGFAGTDSFTVLVTDANGATAISTVTVQVNNRPPTTQNVNLSTPENISVFGQVIGQDPDGDPLTYDLNSQPVNGSVVVNPNGTFTYTPNTNFIGVDTFTVLVSDPSGGSVVSTVTITVVNLPPTTQNVNLTTPENTPVFGQVIATDPNADPLTFTLNSPPVNGTAIVNTDGTFTYTPNPTFIGTDSFTVLVSDGRGGTALSNVTVVVTNQPPVAQNQTLNTPGNTPVAGQIIATDPNADPLTYALNSPPTNGSVIVNADGSFNYTPNTGFVGTDTFTVIVSDPAGASAIATVTINVENLPPITGNQSLATLQNTPVVGQIIATDPNADPLTYSLLSPPSNGAVTVNPDGSFSYQPDVGFVGLDTFSVLVSDGRGGTAVSTVTITVANQPPVVTNQTLSTLQNASVNGQVVATDPDGDPLTYTLQSPPSNGTAVVNADGTFTYTPITGFVGIDSFTVLVSDGKGGTAVGSVMVNVIDQPPITQDLSLSTNFNTPINGQIPATDPDGDTLTYSVSVPPSNGTLVLDPATGAFTYTPNAGFLGVDNFAVLVSDGKGGTAISNVQIGVPVSAPITSDLTLNTNANVPVAGQIQATDPQGETLTYTLTTPPPNGTVVLDPATGAFTYTPNAGFVGTDTFVVTVTNTSGIPVTSTVSVNVDNQPPVAQNLTVDTVQNTPVGGQIPATDPDGNPLTYTVILTPALGTVIVNPDGTFTYTPNAGVVGTDSFTVLVSDGLGGTATSVVTVNIIDQPPVTQDVQISTPANVPINGVVTATDPDGDPLTYTLLSPPANGTATVNLDGTFTYTPNSGFQGQDAFTVLVSDGKGGTTVSTVRIEVVNQPPIVQNETLNTSQSIPISSQVTATDPDGDPLSYALDNPPINGTVVVNPDGTFTYIPDPGYVGTDFFTITVTDSRGGVASAVITVNVNANVPVVFNQTVSTNTNTPISGQVIATDPTGEPITIAVLSPPANGTVTVNPDGTYTYTPNPGFVGTDSFTVQATDTGGGVGTGAVTIIINNIPPVALGTSVSTFENIPVSGVVTAISPVGNPITFSLNSPPVDGTVVVNADGTFTYTPNPGYVGQDSFTVIASDPSGGTAVATAIVTVLNQPPTAQDQNLIGSLNTPVSGQIIASDPNADPLIYLIGSVPVNGTVVLNPDGSFTYTPNTNFAGVDSFTVWVFDINGASTVTTVTITIPILPPVINSTQFTTNADAPVNGQLNATSPEGVPVTVQLATLPVNGTVVVNPDGTFTYQPNLAFVGTDTFTVVATDTYGATTTGTVTILVVAVPPVAPDVFVITPINTPVSGRVTGTDPDTTALIYTLYVPLPANGTAVVNADGTFTYTPNTGYTGVDTFPVIVTDAYGLNDIALVTVTVVGDVPVAPPVNVATIAGQSVSGVIDATDPAGLPLTFSLGASPSNGTVILNPDGTFIYTPNPGFVGSDTFTVVVTNSAGQKTLVPVNVTVVSASGSGPITTSIGVGTNEGQPVSGQILASSPDNLPLSYTIGSSPQNGNVTLSSTTGEFVYVPNSNFTGTDTFTVVVTDSLGRSVTATVTVVVFPVSPSEPLNPVNPVSPGEPGTPPGIPLPPLTITAQLATISGTPIRSAAPGGGSAYILAGGPTHGVISLGADGSYVYTPNPGFVGTDCFTIQYIDAQGRLVQYNVIINVSALSGPLDVGTGAGRTGTDSGVGGIETGAGVAFELGSGILTLNLKGDENQTLYGDFNSLGLGRITRARVLKAPQNGKLTLKEDGSFKLVPNRNYTGRIQFTVIVTDLLGKEYTVQVFVEISAGDDE
ncbi:Ig-like domain-containing protein [Paenibacillus xylanilyticus]|uniref:Tandem-95 repeat protein n=1 Tax=Paenibacillus xylanilyticus TaxID=248903 RepID=A0A7Y6BRY7_9BACL|nr:Ig-like domain-containing protein [Paenibacillus xylanilyticus]NUU73932.1 tandem-95 repeat protein [Paenibacillus xylanilyticus]